MKLITALATVLLALPCLVQAQSSLAKVVFEGRSIAELGALGVEVDHGTIRPGKYIINVYTQSEIAKIKAAGFPVKIHDENVIASWQNQAVNNRSADCPVAEKTYPYPVPDNYKPGAMSGYFTYREMLDNLDSMAAKFPDLITSVAPIDSFQTHEGRPVYWLKMSDNANEQEAEPQVLYTALHHAREPGSLSQLLYFMWYMLENYETDPEVQFLLDNTELYFIPCINPDGYIFNEDNNPQGGGLWRKNRRLNDDGSFGVDLNRNYGFGWGYDDNGSSPNMQSEVYRGPAPFSEPETKAVKYFCEAHQFAVALNYHTYGNLLIYPWAFLDTPSDDSTTFRNFAKAMTLQNEYLAGTGTETVGYVVNGDSDDWMYGDVSAKPFIYSMTPEAGEEGFWAPENRIVFNNQACMWQNLVAANIVHSFGYAKATGSKKIKTLNGKLPFELTRAGLQEGPLQVRLQGLSANVLQTSADKSYQLDLDQTIRDTFDFELTPAIEVDEEVLFLLSVSNGILVWTDTIHRIYRGDLEPALTDDGSTFDNFENTAAGTWGIRTDEFYSAPSCIADSPVGEYDDQVENIMSLKTPVNLSGAMDAHLEFFAKWDIEAYYDYAQVLASTDGINFTPLCGNYTQPGSRYQDEGEPIYDGQNGWVEEVLDLQDFLGAPEVFIRFRLKSDNFVSGDGFNFDDLTLIVKEDNSSGSRQLSISDFVKIEVQPNPADARYKISVDWLEKNNSASSTLHIYNSIGALVEHHDLNPGQTTIDLSAKSLEAGLYTCQIQQAGSMSQAIKFIVLH